MASVTKIEGKNGVSYKIVVTNGVDIHGKKIRHIETWRPEPGMTERQTQKALNLFVTEFEQKILSGYDISDKRNFAEYAKYVMTVKKTKGLKKLTLERYEQLLKRINEEIGAKRLTEIRPHHLNTFYAKLLSEGARESAVKATPKPAVKKLWEETKLPKYKFAELAGTATSNVSAVMRGDTVSMKVAEKVASALGEDVKSLFTITKDSTPLSKKTVLEYHQLISTILAQAEREMIVTYNAASKAEPPRPDKKEVEYFSVDEVDRIQKALLLEPLKWRALTYLLIGTGCRRGEALGLHWDDVDLDRCLVIFRHNLLYSTTDGIFEDTPKTRESRPVTIPLAVAKLLKMLKNWQEGQKSKLQDKWHETPYVFTRDNGEAMFPDAVTQWMYDFSKRHDLPEIHPHKFRHTQATQLIAAGFDDVTVSKRLGHKEVSTTLNIYSHQIAERDAAASDCIGDILFKKQA